MRVVPLLFLLFVFPLFAEETYELKGVHFLATFLQCDKDAISDSKTMLDVMKQAVNKTGATILSDEEKHFFEPQGVSQNFLLSESHASIHTYPEHRACFVDLFTCGDHCDWKPFFEELKNYLKPEKVSLLLLERSDNFKFLDPFPPDTL